MDETNDVQAEVDIIEAEVETLEGESADVQDTTDYKAKYEETMGRLKRAETKLEKSKIEKKVEEKVKEKTGELDENTLDYLDLKGVSESEDVDIVHKIMQKTGMTVRQALKDDYVIERLAKLKAARDVKDATPSSSKRGASQSSDLATALAKFEASGVLPQDFALASQVVNAMESRSNGNKPAWHK